MLTNRKPDFRDPLKKLYASMGLWDKYWDKYWEVSHGR